MSNYSCLFPSSFLAENSYMTMVMRQPVVIQEFTCFPGKRMQPTEVLIPLSHLPQVLIRKLVLKQSLCDHEKKMSRKMSKKRPKHCRVSDTHLHSVSCSLQCHIILTLIIFIKFMHTGNKLPGNKISGSYQASLMF